MVKKILKQAVVKPPLVRSLKKELIAAVHKVLKDNKTELTEKIEKTVSKGIQKIVRKTDEQIRKALKGK